MNEKLIDEPEMPTSVRTKIHQSETTKFKSWLRDNDLEDIIVGRWSWSYGNGSGDYYLCYAYPNKLKEEITFITLRAGSLEEAYIAEHKK